MHQPRTDTSGVAVKSVAEVLDAQANGRARVARRGTGPANDGTPWGDWDKGPVWNDWPRVHH